MFAYFDIINGLPKRGCVSDNDVYSPEGTLARLVTKTLWRIKRAAKARSLLLSVGSRYDFKPRKYRLPCCIHAYCLRCLLFQN